MIRGVIFQIAYLAVSVFYVIMACLSVIFPGKFVTRWIVRRYSQRMISVMKYTAGIEIEYRGLNNLPDGPFILAPKHQSWGDGFAAFSKVDNLVFVTGNHLEKIPLLKGVLAKIGAIVVDNCGGGTAKNDLAAGAQLAFKEGKRILIYPEGHLSKPGQHHRYRPGLWHLYDEHKVPVVPAATNLGEFWQQTDIRKRKGKAVVQFLEPIPVGWPKDHFMQMLEQRIEAATYLLRMQSSEEYSLKLPPDSELVAFKGEHA